MSNTVAPEACEICQRDGKGRRNSFVALPAEDERLEDDVERLLAHLAGRSRSVLRSTEVTR